MQHSKIVGGSTAKRVIACPGSVALVDKLFMPPLSVVQLHLLKKPIILLVV